MEARRQAVKCNAKLIPAIAMNVMAMISSSILFQCARLAPWVENPPMATVLNACPTASNNFIPPSQ